MKSFTYDDDQNLIEDGSFEYAYDAENRLIEVLPAEDDPNNLTADDNKLVFTYDYLNRRVRKVVYAWDPNEGDSGDWSATAELDLRFIYHERLLLLELDGLDSNAKVRKHVWGPGSDGRLGGLNSLLGVRDIDSDTNYVCFNNGTGSVAQLLDRSDGSVDAKYVYDTRGDTIRENGTYAADNPLRYKAMYFDAEFDYAGTDCDGLYCAADGGCYSPRTCRWLPAPSELPGGQGDLESEYKSAAHAGALPGIVEVLSDRPPPLAISWECTPFGPWLPLNPPWVGPHMHPIQGGVECGWCQGQERCKTCYYVIGLWPIIPDRICQQRYRCIDIQIPAPPCPALPPPDIVPPDWENDIQVAPVQPVLP